MMVRVNFLHSIFLALFYMACWGVFLVFTSSCRPDQLVHYNSCGAECYTGDQKDVGHGVCRSGQWFCPDDDESKRVCQGAVEPSAEVCDGLDNDCDGIVDNLKIAPRDAFCYQGSDESLSYGSCRPGSWRCINATMVCNGQVLPHTESCDGIDNDCDGVIDNGVNSTTPVDLVFIIDNSCSMESRFYGPATAITSFAGQYGSDPSINWALVSAPSIDPSIPVPVLEEPLGPIGPFQTAFSQQNGSTGSGSEPTLDAVYDVCKLADPLGLGWTVGSHKVALIFTDEEPQSYRVPKVTAQMVKQTCSAAGVTLYGFVSFFGGLPQTDWGQIVLATGGQAYNIASSNLGPDLENVVKSSTCRGPQ